MAYKPIDAMLEEMLGIATQRRELYGDNQLMVGKLIAILFPDGVELLTPEDHNKWHMFVLLLVKVTRLANTKLSHRDSAIDAGNYAAGLAGMIDEDKDE